MNEHAGKNVEKLKKVFAVLKFVILIGILIGIPLYIFLFHRDFLAQFDSLESFRALLQQYKAQSFAFFLIAQIIQIIISVIPGQWIQLGAGFTYGIIGGYLISLLGAFLGAMITYFLAAFLGRDALVVFFGEEKVNHYVERMNSKRAMLIVFFIYLIPGLPKDLCNYIAGISDMKLRPFMILSLLGRSPAMLGSIIIGRQIGVGSYTSAIIIFAGAVVLFVLSIIFRKPLMAKFDSFYDHISGEEKEEQEEAGEGDPAGK